MTTVKLTGPQLEVIALLAEGLPLTDIAAKTGGDTNDVQDTIWAACRTVGAVDRCHLIAIAFRLGLLHTPALATARAEAQQYHAELERADEAARTADSKRQQAARDRDAWKRKHDDLEATIKPLRQELATVRAAAKRTAKQAGPTDEATAVWFLEQLALHARQARDRAAYHSGPGTARMDLAHTADTLGRVATTIAQAWRQHTTEPATSP